MIGTEPPEPSSPTATSGLSGTAAPEHQIAVSYPLLTRALQLRTRWWRPMVAVVVAAVVYAVLFTALLLGLMLLSEGLGLFAPVTDEVSDMRSPADVIAGFGSLAVGIPAVLAGLRVGYGTHRIALSITGRFRWKMLGRSALLVLPVYLLVNTVIAPIALGVAPSAPVITGPAISAFMLALLLVPFQAAAEEFAFRALPMLTLGTWLRWPLIGIVLPIPLFVLGHEYEMLGQVDLVIFSVCMGALAWRSGGIELPVLLHVANNGTLLLLSPFVPGIFEQGEVTAVMFLLATIPTVACTAGLWWWIGRREGLGLLEPARAAGTVSASDSPPSHPADRR